MYLDRERTRLSLKYASKLFSLVSEACLVDFEDLGGLRGGGRFGEVSFKGRFWD